MDTEIEKEIKKLSLHIVTSNLRKNLLKQKNNLKHIDKKIYVHLRNAEDTFSIYTKLIETFRRLHTDHALESRNELDSLLADEHLKNLPHFFSFLNRCTIKLLEMDQQLNRIISHAHFATQHNQLRFLDLCGGPGGFSEYLLLIHKWKCKGIGVTLKGELDYKLKNFHVNSPTTSFLNLNTILESSSKGSLFEKEVEIKIEEVLKSHFNNKVDLVLADGAGGQQQDQEIEESKDMLLLQIYQVYFTCKHLEKKGLFVIKFFDITLPETIRLVYFLNIAFEKIRFLKLDLSRKVNSERYVVCECFRFEQHQCTIDLLKKYIFEGKNDNLFADSKQIFQELTPNLTKHLLETWREQENKLQELIKHCKEKEKQTILFPLKEEKIQISIKECYKQMSEYWKKWNLAWFHDLHQEVPHIFFQFPKKEKRIPLYDNWNQLHHNTRYLSSLQNYIRYQSVRENIRVVYITQGKLLDRTLQVIEPSTNVLKALTQYPTNTIVVVLNDTEIKNILAIPLYPKLFLQDPQEIKQIWNLFDKNLYFWKV